MPGSRSTRPRPTVSSFVAALFSNPPRSHTGSFLRLFFTETIGLRTSAPGMVREAVPWLQGRATPLPNPSHRRRTALGSEVRTRQAAVQLGVLRPRLELSPAALWPRDLRHVTLWRSRLHLKSEGDDPFLEGWLGGRLTTQGHVLTRPRSMSRGLQ